MTPFQRVGLPLAVSAAALSLPAVAAPGCSARSAGVAPSVVELYTSEGCSSCPPADRWLSRLPGETSIVALAFHVDYWDRLGWRDRFASPAYTQRQAAQQRSSGARFSYTPQVLVDGADRPDWPRAAIPARRGLPAPVEVTLARDGARYSASVTPAASAPPLRLAAYWAVTERNHLSAVKAGENEGATLHHDHVVREYRPIGAWPAAAGGSATTLSFEPSLAADPTHPREINLVIVDDATGRPVQAVKLGC